MHKSFFFLFYLLLCTMRPVDIRGPLSVALLCHALVHYISGFLRPMAILVLNVFLGCFSRLVLYFCPLPKKKKLKQSKLITLLIPTHKTHSLRQCSLFISFPFVCSTVLYRAFPQVLLFLLNYFTPPACLLSLLFSFPRFYLLLPPSGR